MTKRQDLRDRSAKGDQPATPLVARSKIEDVVGILDYDGPALSIDEMDAAVAAEGKRRYAREAKIAGPRTRMKR